MNLIVYKFSKSGSNYRPIEIECKGKGTAVDPIEIEPSAKIPKENLLFLNSNLYINFENCPNQVLNIMNCKNITVNTSNDQIEINIRRSSGTIVKNHLEINEFNIFESHNIEIQYCSIGRLEIFKSHDIEIKNCSIFLNFKNSGCYQMNLEGCSISRLNLYQCLNNVFKNCSIDKLKIIYSKANIFEKITIPEKLSSKLTKNSIDLKNIKILSTICFLIIGLSFLLSFFFPINILYNIIMLIIALSLICMVLSIFLGIEMRLFKEFKNDYAPNKIIKK